jgi:hypothetical protein
MAKKVLTEQYYTFTPTLRQVSIPKAIQRENLVLITNVTQNKVIYNFSDPNLTATAYTVNNGTTAITLNYNTTTMSSNDALQFVYDDTVQEIIPAETYQDPVQKMRVSTPQSLIDTDFEYGTQPTKWENLSLLNGRPSFYVDLQAPIAITDVQATNGSKNIIVYATYTSGTGNITTNTTTTNVVGSGTSFLTQIFPGYALYNSSDILLGIVSTIESDTSLTLQSNASTNQVTSAFRFAPQRIPDIGTPLQIQETLFTSANGGYLIELTTPVIASGRWELRFRASANYPGTTGSIFNTGLTACFAGSFYSNSQITLTSATAFSATAAGSAANDIVVSITTARNHGLSIGNLIYLTGSCVTSIGTNPGGTSYTVIAVYSPTRFGVIMAAGSLVPTITGIGTLTCYVRNESTFAHRPFDGGVRFSTNTQSHNYQALRQTRRYFRYQSGKGIQFSTGSVLRPNFTLDAITSIGNIATATSKEPHNLQPGISITIFGATEPGIATSAYNGAFTVLDVNSEFEFTYTMTSTPSTTTAFGFPQVGATGWRGSGIRVGMFDQNNGFYFEYDGNQLYAVRRSSTLQLSGLTVVTNGSDQVVSLTTLGVGKQTKFLKQLTPGEWIVIRGQSYRVMEVINDQRIRINPEYRGASISGGIISKVVETKIAQTSWNIDRCDGYGPSGFTLDLNKMQMIYADYAWYGAGSIRFGFKDQEGRIIYCHRIVNSNQNTEAYMRSGNLPARYEVHTIPSYTYLTGTFTSGATTLTVASTADFPNSGVLLIGDPGRTSADAALTSGGPATADYYEYVQYNSKTATTFNITQRGAGLGMTGATIDGYRSNYFNTAGGTVTTVSGSNTVTTSKGFAANSVGTAINMAPIGSFVTGTGIPENTYITGFNASSSTIELSQAATASGAITNFLVYATSSNANGTNNSGATHTYDTDGPVIPVYLHTNQFAPTANHWGTAVIMDGRYDDDKSLVFTAGNASYVTNYTSTINAVMSIRVAPSVDNGTSGTLGVKEVINRMQLTLRSLGVTSNGAYFVRVILNPRFITNAPTFQNVGGSSLSQVAYHPNGTQISGGETIFAFYTDQGGGGLNYTVTSAELDKVRDLGNSVLGGGLTNVVTLNSGVGIYPDGPDVLTICCSNVLQPVTVSPTTTTSGSPIVIVTDVTGFDLGWVVSSSTGGTAVGGVVKSITARSAGGFDVAFSKNSTNGTNGTFILSPPGNIASRISWTEAQA